MQIFSSNGQRSVGIMVRVTVSHPLCSKRARRAKQTAADNVSTGLPTSSLVFKPGATGTEGHSAPGGTDSA